MLDKLVVEWNVRGLRSANANRRAKAKAALIAMGSEAVPRLIDLVANGKGRFSASRDALQDAVEILGEIKDRRSIEALVSVLQRTPSCELAVVRALANIKDPASVDALIQVLLTDNKLRTHGYAQRCAAECLGDMNVLQTLPAMITATTREPLFTVTIRKSGDPENDKHRFIVEGVIEKLAETEDGTAVLVDTIKSGGYAHIPDYVIDIVASKKDVRFCDILLNALETRGAIEGLLLIDDARVEPMKAYLRHLKDKGGYAGYLRAPLLSKTQVGMLLKCIQEKKRYKVEWELPKIREEPYSDYDVDNASRITIESSGVVNVIVSDETTNARGNTPE